MLTHKPHPRSVSPTDPNDDRGTQTSSRFRLRTIKYPKTVCPRWNPKLGRQFRLVRGRSGLKLRPKSRKMFAYRRQMRDRRSDVLIRFGRGLQMDCPETTGKTQPSHRIREFSRQERTTRPSVRTLRRFGGQQTTGDCSPPEFGRFCWGRPGLRRGRRNSVRKIRTSRTLGNERAYVADEGGSQAEWGGPAVLHSCSFVVYPALSRLSSVYQSLSHL